MSTTPLSTEHEVLTYVRVSEKLDQLHPGQAIPMEKNTPLSVALDAMNCIPFVQFPVALAYSAPVNKCAFTIAGVEAGTLGNPDVDLILQKSTPAFGRGSENIMDPSYRSGREISAVNLGMDENIMRFVREDVNEFMFKGRMVELKLYKLAVYETGGHFDWHVDSTHSDNHHATLLVALNSSWKGGDLVLRCDGIETHVDLRPQASGKEGQPTLQAVAFFTDIEHRVEPVIDGIRIILQYDVEVVDQQEEEEEENEPWLDQVGEKYYDRTRFHLAQAIEDKVAVGKVLDVVTELHKSGVEDVGFALQYLYRQASICAEYLKGSDAILYNALSAHAEFDVSLAPVVLCEASNWNGDMDQHDAYRFDDAEINTSKYASPEKKKKNSREFHISQRSAVQKISSQSYIEHTGNEAMPAEYRYFGGGMFVRSKAY